jgi:hypothetical protein
LDEIVFDAGLFEQYLRSDLEKRQLTFAGPMPTLVDDDGREFYVGNLAQSCESAPTIEWRRIIREFLDSFESIDSFVAISPDVARMSLRLRLYNLTEDSSSATSDSATAQRVMKAAVHWTALPGLHWVLFVKRGGAAQNVLPEQLVDWEIAIDEAWELAKKHTLRHEGGELTEYDDMAAYSGDSMFTTAGVLRSQRWLANATHGLFVSTPTRHHVLARTVDRDGVALLSNFFQMTLDVYQAGPYPLCTDVWWVPPVGPGERGEQAELIRLVSNGINEDGQTTFGLAPGERLEEALRDLELQ